MLNILWIGFFLIACATGLIRFLWLGDAEIFNRMMQAVFTSSKTAFEIALGLTGTLAFWLGMLQVGQSGGFIRLLTRGLNPLFRRLLPDVPKDHPALGAIVMNLAANMLGLDNAATPFGIKAMHELQALNAEKETASDAQILFFVINASSVTLLPVAIFTYRAQMGAANPTDVFIPILIATFGSTLTGLLSVALVQKINLLDRAVLAYLGSMTLMVAGLLFYFLNMDQAVVQEKSALLSNGLLLALIMAFLLGAVFRRRNAFEAFIEGAREGFQTAVGILPYLVAMLVAIGVFRASGVLESIIEGARMAFGSLGLDTRFVDALPTALIKPFSGSGARAMMLDTMQTFGADSFSGRLSCIIQGSTETTFYVLAVYFGAVGIKNIRHAVSCALLADTAGVLAAIGITYQFFG
jgi:spore maturation protein SpmA